MYTARDISLKIIIPFAWRTLLFFTVYSLAISALYAYLEFRFLAMPFLPIGLIGTAVAFYVGFKNNSSYERLWEARKIWGNLVNQSRLLGVYVLAYVTATDFIHEEEAQKERKEIIYRHLAFLNVLRVQLRKNSAWDCNYQTSLNIVTTNTPFKNEKLHEMASFLPVAEVAQLQSAANPVTQILKDQSLHLTQLNTKGCIEHFRHLELMRLIGEFYSQQGACERIKTFPFPRQYAYFSKLFVWLFILVLPLGLVAEFSKLGTTYVWLTVPFYVLIAWVFNTMEVVGDTSENPFENGINDIPMTAICRNIEIDLKQMLGENELPTRIEPYNNILM